MNYHTRSYSEQPQVPAASVAGGGGGGGGGAGGQPQSFIRFHSDSQQSLDQLFNPQSQSSVPLRNRNLPLSFFNPSLKTESNDSSNETTNNGNSNTNGSSNAHINNNLHNRSISLNHHQQVPAARATHRLNLHMRTHSTLAPMPRLLSNHSSNQSSQEFLNNPVQPQTHPQQQQQSQQQQQQQQQQHDTDGIVSSTNNVSNLNTDRNNYHLHHQSQHHHNNSNINNNNNNNNHHHHHNHHHHNNHNHHSNGWTSAGNSMDDLSSANPNWIAGQPTPNHTIPIQQTAQVAAGAVTAQHQPMIQGPVPMQHQQVFHNVNPLPSVPQQQQPANHVCSNHLHSRSISFNQRPDTRATGHGFHMRTHSTIAPMSGTCTHHQVNSHVSSHQSSQEFSINSNNTNTSSSTGWSSSGYSTDDMTASGQCWTAAGQPHPTTAQLPLQASPMANATPSHPTNLHHHNHHHHQATIQQQHQQSQQAQQQLFYHV